MRAEYVRAAHLETDEALQISQITCSPRKKKIKKAFFFFYTKEANASVCVQMYVRVCDMPSSQ